MNTIARVTTLTRVACRDEVNEVRVAAIRALGSIARNAGNSVTERCQSIEGLKEVAVISKVSGNLEDGKLATYELRRILREYM